ncbi:MAG: Holliday junction branch migration protein RuvA [Oscillospiraceae bacterium]
MFYYIEGKVTVLEPNFAAIDCGGVAYAVNTTANTISRLQIGEKARLYTYCYIREDAFDIYGFYSLSEKRSFEMLIGVSGVGPKAALSILSSGTPESLAMAIVAGDEKALTLAPGIGKKIAQRVILELKDKMAKVTENIGLKTSAAPYSVKSDNTKLGDAAAALTVLGYGNAEICAALNAIDTDSLELEGIIRQALKLMLRQ